MSLKNILVIKLRYIGDVLLATPVLSALRNAYPRAHLAVAVNEETEDILRHNPDVNEIVVVRRTSWREQFAFLRALRARRFECVIDLTDGDRSALITWATGAPVRIGFNDERRCRGAVYSSIIPKAAVFSHRTTRDMSAIEAVGLRSTPGPLTLRVGPVDEAGVDRLLAERGIRSPLQDAPLVMFQPGARYWFKAWPLDRFAQLGARLVQRWNCRILIGGNEAERHVCEDLAGRIGGAATSVAGQLTLLEYAAAVTRCGLFVGNDNGAMHMAAARGTPVVGLFGPSNPKEWGPCGPRTAVLYKGLDCRACFHPTCHRGELNCMRQISVDEVFDAAMQLVEARPVSMRS